MKNKGNVKKQQDVPAAFHVMFYLKISTKPIIRRMARIPFIIHSNSLNARIIGKNIIYNNNVIIDITSRSYENEMLWDEFII